MPTKIDIIALVSFILIADWGLSSCKDSGTGVSQIIFPDTNVSYGKHVQPLFNQECAVPGCHTQETRAGNLSLETYSDAIAAPLIIIPKDTVNSVLVWSIEAKNGQPHMPPAGSNLSLTSNQIHGLRQWISEGARDN